MIWLVGVGRVFASSQRTAFQERCLKAAFAEGYITHRTHYPPDYPMAATQEAYEVTDKGMNLIRRRISRMEMHHCMEIREYYRHRAHHHQGRTRRVRKEREVERSLQQLQDTWARGGAYKLVA